MVAVVLVIVEVAVVEAMTELAHAVEAAAEAERIVVVLSVEVAVVVWVSQAHYFFPGHFVGRERVSDCQ